MAVWGFRVNGKHTASDRLTRRFGTIAVTQNGSITLPGDGRPFAFFRYGAATGQRRLPQITIDGMTIRWTVTDLTGVLHYGVY